MSPDFDFGFLAGAGEFVDSDFIEKVSAPEPFERKHPKFKAETGQATIYPLSTELFPNRASRSISGGNKDRAYNQTIPSAR